MPPNDATLFGIVNSNRKISALWGKNQFNSSFPVALACYMKEAGVPAVYLKLDNELKVRTGEVSIDDVFNTSLPCAEIRFNFESKFDPYQEFAHEDIGNIDLVVKDEARFLTPLEIKLTALPDNTTAKMNENLWGSELVIRPDTTKYCGLSIVNSCRDHLGDFRTILEPRCHGIRNWDNKHEINAVRNSLFEALHAIQKKFFEYQRPFLMQPIWKTEGQNPTLAENAFDIFVWSDFALFRMILDRALIEAREGNINRYMRSVVRFAKLLYEVSIAGKAGIRSIYTDITFGLQTDKELAINGRVSRTYMNCKRLNTPLFPRAVIRKIILNGGEKLLKPERRFDATVYYTAETLFSKPMKT